MPFQVASYWLNETLLGHFNLPMGGNSFSAEFHEEGAGVVGISTGAPAGGAQGWREVGKKPD